VCAAIAGPPFAATVCDALLKPAMLAVGIKLKSVVPIQEHKDVKGDTIGVDQLLNKARYTSVGMTTPRFGASISTAKG